MKQNANLYLLGMAASFLGGSAMILTAGIWVKSLTGSSAMAALVSACIYAPAMLGPFAGLLADRVRRRPLLIAVNVTAATAMISLLFVQSADQVWLIYTVMTCYGVALALMDPAEQGLFVAMLSTVERQRVNGLRMSIQEGGKLVAPLAGAGLFALLGGGPVAALTASTFVIAAVVIARLQVSEPPPSPGGGGLLAELAGGFRHLNAQRELRIVALAASVAMFGSGFLVAAQFSMVDALGRPPSFLGVVSGLVGAGSIVSSLVSARLIRRYGESRLLLLGLINGTVGYLLVAVGSIATVLPGAFVLGFALPWSVIAVVNLGQRLTPVHVQGRVASALGLMLFAPQPLALLGGASAMNVVSDYATVYAVVAAVGAATATWVAFARRARVHPTSAKKVLDGSLP